ncbi:ribonucleoprotein-associated protein [Colletotrichum costaricense]|uniref:Ribonucleoprotein-associated protein n=1 Tax=Colletotrichum costaricense TaxID=1209916 RepID=A0AAJ0E715_9PEZI|nr:ribonucleoprotein-associated protein [Colletotrichum costaricense]KAK1538996.1 ribonucleoprotein-associated protein [Colletotrichum costaricense]
MRTASPQNQLKPHRVFEDGPEPTLTESSTEPLSSENFMSDLFELLWLAFDNGQAVQVEAAVAAGDVELVVWARSSALRFPDILASLVEDQVRELCQQHQIATVTIPSMYELGHACGLGYRVGVAAVTLQEGSELMESIEEMKAKIQRLECVSEDSQIGEAHCAKDHRLKSGEFQLNVPFAAIAWGSLSSMSDYDSDYGKPILEDDLE